MSIFRSMVNRIFGRPGETEATVSAKDAAEAGSAPLSAAPDSAPEAPGHTQGPPDGPVDVEAILTGMASKAGQPLDWRRSIVDLMKVLGLDSSLIARKELAKELGYSGSTDDTAAMNMWLHREVMRKFAEHGGTLPDDLKA